MFELPARYLALDPGNRPDLGAGPAKLLVREPLSEIAASLKERVLTAEQLVEHFVRAAIMSGIYRPGERLMQDAIARILGISRIPVRAGLRALESDGLVRIVPYRGTVVTSLTPQEIAEIYELRAAIECYLIECLAGRITPHQMQRLRRAVEVLEEARPFEFPQLRVAFYVELYSIAERPTALKTVTRLHNKIDRYLLSARVIKADHCHSELLDHLEAGDVSAAQDWLRKHLHAVSEEVQIFVAQVEHDLLEVNDSCSPIGTASLMTEGTGREW